MAWSDNDYRALTAAAAQVGTRPLDLLVVLASESGLKPDAVAIVDGAPYALGLNQITPPNAKAMGIYPTPWESIPKMGVGEQIPYVVKSLLAATGGRKRSYYDAGELYQSNFAPATLAKGTTDGTVLFASPSGGYKNNKALDYRNRGKIVVGDLRWRLRLVAEQPWFRAHVERMRTLGLVAPNASPVIRGPWWWWPWAAGGAAATAGLGALLIRPRR